MKSVLLIGLGRFGRHMAQKLQELHHEVLAVDKEEQRVNDALPYVTNAQIGDATNEQFVASLGSRAARDVHAKFLLRNGADDVIYPERQMASWAAVRYSSGHIFDYVELTPEYSIFETAVPESWVGKTVVDLEVRQKYRINILAIQRGGKLEPLPGPGHCFQAHETMFILGDNRDMKKFLRLS